MRVLFVGVFTPNSTNISLAKGFKRAGPHEVLHYDYRAQQRELGSEFKRDGDLCTTITEWRPDLTVFAKCNRMSVTPVLVANTVGVSCLWYMDPLNGNFNAELIDKIEAATFSCFALQAPREEGERHTKHAYLVPEGYDEDVDYPAEVEKVRDTGFIGDLRGERATYQSAVGFPVISAWGRNHAIEVSRTKINLNFTEGGTSDRTYKVLAARGFLLTQPWPGMTDFFIPGKHLDVFRDERELLRQIEFYLKNEDAREQIAQQGYEKNEPYTREYWASRIIEIAKELS